LKKELRAREEWVNIFTTTINSQAVSLLTTRQFIVKYSTSKKRKLNNYFNNVFCSIELQMLSLCCCLIYYLLSNLLFMLSPHFFKTLFEKLTKHNIYEFAKSIVVVLWQSFSLAFNKIYSFIQLAVSNIFVLFGPKYFRDLMRKALQESNMLCFIFVCCQQCTIWHRVNSTA
jgi:hypothetical protein